MINIAKDGTGSERKEGWEKSRDQESYSDTHSAVYGHVRSKASRAKEGKKGSGLRAQERRGWNSRRRVWKGWTEHAQTHILRRTSVFKHAWWEGGARGWNRDPIVLRCEACARKGVDGEAAGEGRGAAGEGRFAHAARAAFTKGWNRLEAIHSFGCPVFFPRVWLGEHRRPPSSSPLLLSLRLSLLSVAFCAYRYAQLLFLSLFLSLSLSQITFW